jgi:hypothetical protein
MARLTAVVTAVYLVVVFFCFANSFVTRVKLSKINPIFNIWHIGATLYVDFMIPV